MNWQRMRTWLRLAFVDVVVDDFVVDELFVGELGSEQDGYMNSILQVRIPFRFDSRDENVQCYRQVII